METVTETECTKCTHRNVCKWTESFLHLVERINETQFKYATDVDIPVYVRCREKQEEQETAKITFR